MSAPDEITLPETIAAMQSFHAAVRSAEAFIAAALVLDTTIGMSDTLNTAHGWRRRAESYQEALEKMDAYFARLMAREDIGSQAHATLKKSRLALRTLISDANTQAGGDDNDAQ